MSFNEITFEQFSEESKGIIGEAMDCAEDRGSAIMEPCDVLAACAMHFTRTTGTRLPQPTYETVFAGKP